MSNKAIHFNALEDPRLTPKGKRWLHAALSPMQDTDLDLSGYPDQRCGKSFTVVRKGTIEVTRPSSVPSTDNWSAHIFSLPIANYDATPSAYTTTTATCFETTIDSNTNIANFGTVNAWTGANGFKAYGTANAMTFGDTKCWNPTEPEGPCRIFGGGVKVLNTTSTLYDQGKVVAYCFDPAMEKGAGVVDNDITPDELPTQLVNYTAPPNSVTDAIRLTNSKSWEAKHGCYFPLRISTADNSYSRTNWNVLNFMQKDATPGKVDAFCSAVAADSGMARAGDRTMQFHTEIGGAYFTNLHPDAVLDVEITLFIEMLPGPNSSLAESTTPSSPYDPLALQYYNEIICKMPPGDYASANSLGTWLKDVLKIGSKMAVAIAPIVRAINPVAGTVVGALGAAGSAATAEDQKVKTKALRTTAAQKKK